MSDIKTMTEIVTETLSVILKPTQPHSSKLTELN